jgi:hypothetical protein
MPKIKIPMMAIISKIIELLTLTEKRPIDQDLHINQDLHIDGKNSTVSRDRAVTVTISETKVQ